MRVYLQSLSPEDKAQQLEELTGGTESGVGDVEAVSNVLTSIGISDNEEILNVTLINENTTQNILNSVSNIVDSDLNLPRDEAAIQNTSQIGDRYIFIQY